MGAINQKMESFGLVDIKLLAPKILSDIRYSTPDNFTGKVLYTESFGLYAVRQLAQSIADICKWLARNMPGHRLVVFDAARPLSIQREMFELVRGSEFEPYIANPYSEITGGFHNYGLAVDMTLADSSGKPLDMGTDYDFFGEEAHSFTESYLFEKGKISQQALANRLLLYSVAARFGLLPHPNEWWHFQLTYDEESKKQFRLLDF